MTTTRMAAGRYNTPNDMRRNVGSPRPKTRDNKDTLCRNITIYGHCRYQDSGCTFNHETPSKNTIPSQPQNDMAAKRAMNVDSPSFTPASLQQPAAKNTPFSKDIMNAAVFTPRAAGGVSGASTPSLQQRNVEAPVFNPATVRDFTPQNYDYASSTSTNGVSQDSGIYTESYVTQQTTPSMTPAAQLNPYDMNNMAVTANAAYYQGQAGYSGPFQPPQYHMYAPVGPYREDLLPYQRATYDFFMPEKLRNELQRKAFATLQVMPNMPLTTLEHYHSLVPLDTHPRRNASIFGYPSWVYKATSSKTGKVYCLRRLEGYRLTNEQAIQPSRTWRRLINANVVTLHEAFTTRTFGDSSLIFAYDYHPCSQTLSEHHFPQQTGRYRPPTAIPENVLWGYICQIANALKAIHGANLAARCIDMTKIIVTDKDRIRLAAPAVLDVVQFENKRPSADLQQNDFIQFGKVIYALAAGNTNVHLNNIQAALDSLSVKYSQELTGAVRWLLTARPQAEATSPTTPTKRIDEFLSLIAGRMTTTLNSAFSAQDTTQSELFRELENGRLVRLLCKLGAINERGEYDGDPLWSEHGERYQLKLFRDYVFHQVDADGNPHVDLGHMIQALNKLDAGSEERVRLVSRNEETVFVVSYREIKAMLNSAFGELLKSGKGSGGL